MRILIAEDEELLLKALAFRLKKVGFEVITADNGKIAIDMLKGNLPDLVITDVMMPFATGLEVISHVRTQEKSSVPIIVLSEAGQENIVLEAFNLGADDFVNKPFSPNELTSRVKRLLRA